MDSRSTNRFGFFSSPLLVISVLSAATVIGSILVEALIPVSPLCVQQRPYQITTRLSLQKGWLDNNDDENNANYNNNNNNNNNNNGEDDDDDVGLVTREDVNRDLLGLEPIVKRKRKNGKQGGGGYRPLDNRDHLPFSIRTNTPEDPYKTKFLKERQKQEENKINDGITNNKNKKTTTDLEHHMLPSTNRISPSNNKKKKNNKKQSDNTPSRLVQISNKDNNDKMSETVIGEYQLDKSTTSGDVIVIGEKEYQVQQARCQYKYAGGQRFVMVRKILEVKEVNRVQNEEALMRQYKKSSSSILPEGSLD